MYGIIYKVTNKINGKVYIGQTVTTLKSRMSKHICDTKNKPNTTYFHLAIKKYGIENFEYKQIDFAETKDFLNENEKYYINLYSSNNRNNGYNLTEGGEGSVGYKHSEEAKLKIRTTERKSYPRGFKRTQESKDKQSKTRMGMKFSDEHKKKIGIGNKNKHFRFHSEASKIKISLKKKNKPWTQARRDAQNKRSINKNKV